MKTRSSFDQTMHLIVVTMVAICASGCAMTKGSTIPHVENAPFTVTRLDYVPPMSDVTGDLRRQIQAAYDHVPYLMKKYEHTKASEGLTPKTGTVVVSGKVQQVGKDSASTMAVFVTSSSPTGSMLTPNIGISTSATAVVQQDYTFSITPKRLECWNVEDDRVLADGPEKDAWEALKKECRKSIDWGKETGWRALDLENAPPIPEDDEFTRILVAAFEQIASASDAEKGGSSFLTRTDRELKLTVSFAVVLEGQLGLGFKIVPSTSVVDSISGSPALGVSGTDTGTYTATITIPLVTPAASDPKRIITGRVESNGRTLLLDVPFTKDSWAEVGGGTIPGEERPPSNRLIPQGAPPSPGDEQVERLQDPFGGMADEYEY